MISKISSLLSRRIGVKLNSSDDEIEVFAYSIEVLSSLLINIVLLLIVAVILNKEIELFVFLVFFSGLRTFAGGYHAKTHAECILLSLTLFLIIALCSTYITDIGGIIVAVGIFLSTILVFWLAPSESENKPLSKNKRIKFKKISRLLIILLNLVVIVLFFYRIQTDNIYLTAVISLIFESVSLLKK